MRLQEAASDHVVSSSLLEPVIEGYNGIKTDDHGRVTDFENLLYVFETLRKTVNLDDLGKGVMDGETVGFKCLIEDS